MKRLYEGRVKPKSKNSISMMKVGNSTPLINHSSNDPCTSGFSPEIFEGVVAFSGDVKLGSITNAIQSAT